MIKFRTEIGKLTYPFHIQYGDKTILMGSCFSNHVGAKLEKYKFGVLSNPLGIIFNPISIAQSLEYIIGENKLKLSQLKFRDNLWHHFDFHGSFSHPEKEVVLSEIHQQILASAKYLKKADFLFITFGTADIFALKNNRQVVANNHKFPIDDFVKMSLEVEEIVERYRKLIKKILSINSKLKIVYTISPVRYIRDGLIENQKSKATLLLAVDQLVDGDRSFYFPSYEIFNDDLRDYRFYKEDLIHPSEEGINYTWNIFVNSFMNESTQLLQKEIKRYVKSINHRPIHEKSKNHQNFLLELEKDLIAFKQVNPGIDFSKELQYLDEKCSSKS